MVSSSARLAVFIPKLGGGGAERSMLRLVGAFAARGHHVDLVTCRATGAFSGLIPADVRLVELGPSRTITALPGLTRYLRRVRPAAMLSALNHANVVALWARRWARSQTRLVVSERNTPSEEVSGGGWKERAIAALIGRYYRWADDIVAVSNGVAADLCEMSGLPRCRVKVIYNPVVTPEMSELMRAEPQHPWFTDLGPPIVLGVGRLEPVKNFAALVRAFARVHAQRPCRLVILGEGSERGRLQALVERLAVSASVALPGFEPNPFACMSRAAVAVLASLWEGFPNTLAEALACGTTVVSTNCRSGPAEILEDGKYGLLVPPGDEAALASAIHAALDRPFAAAMLQRRARDFSLERSADEYLSALLG
jgi:glycosyltransferase involved in cell wall biosynthesis